MLVKRKRKSGGAYLSLVTLVSWRVKPICPLTAVCLNFFHLSTVFCSCISLQLAFHWAKWVLLAFFSCCIGGQPPVALLLPLCLVLMEIWEAALQLYSTGLSTVFSHCFQVLSSQHISQELLGLINKFLTFPFFVTLSLSSWLVPYVSYRFTDDLIICFSYFFHHGVLLNASWKSSFVQEKICLTTVSCLLSLVCRAASHSSVYLHVFNYAFLKIVFQSLEYHWDKTNGSVVAWLAFCPFSEVWVWFQVLLGQVVPHLHLIEACPISLALHLCLLSYILEWRLSCPYSVSTLNPLICLSFWQWQPPFQSLILIRQCGFSLDFSFFFFFPYWKPNKYINSK